MENVLVTGGAGFVGSHIVDELVKRKKKVRVFDNLIGGDQNVKGFPKGVEFVKGDCCNREDCKKAVDGIDTVFHLAAHAAEGQSVFIPEFNAETNLMGSIVMLSEAINAGVENFAFTSSIAAYGSQEKLPIKEDARLTPDDPYAITKKTFEDYLHVYHELVGIKPFIVRFFNVYGPRQRMDDPYRGVVPIFINKCLKGERPVIFGDGLQARAFTYISDVVEPICDIVGNEKLVDNPVNIGTEEVHSVKELGEMTIKKMGVDLELEYLPKRTSDVKIAYCDMGKARELFGYKAKIGFEEGMEKTIEWAKKEGPKEFKYMPFTEIPKLTQGMYTSKKI